MRVTAYTEHCQAKLYIAAILGTWEAQTKQLDGGQPKVIF